MNRTRTAMACSGLSIKEISKQSGVARSTLEAFYKCTGVDLTPQEQAKVEKVCDKT